MNGMSRERIVEFSHEPGGVLFGHVEDGEGKDGRIAVRVDFENFFFYFFVVLLDGFAKEDHLIGFFNVVLPRRPEVKSMHTGNDINAPHEAFFQEMPTDILGLTKRFTGDVDKNHRRHIIFAFYVRKSIRYLVMQLPAR